MKHPIEQEKEYSGSTTDFPRLLALVILVLIFVGAFFLYLGLRGMDNSLTVAAGAAMGSALFVGAILIITVLGFEALKSRLTEQTKLLKQQNAYLRYLAESMREERKNAKETTREG